MDSNKNVNIMATDSALMQIKIILENDFTLENMVFRVSIGGKGCDGFTYQTGFTAPHIDDVILSYPVGPAIVAIHMDPFTAHYFNRGRIDYLLDPTSNKDGFVIENYDEANYVGKFFKDETKMPVFPNTGGDKP